MTSCTDGVSCIRRSHQGRLNDCGTCASLGISGYADVERLVSTGVE